MADPFSRSRRLLCAVAAILAAVPAAGHGKTFETAEPKSMQQKDQSVKRPPLDATSRFLT